MQRAFFVRQHPLVVQHKQSSVFCRHGGARRQWDGGVTKHKLRSFILTPLLVHAHHLVHSLIDLAACKILGVWVDDAHIQPSLACQAGQRQGIDLAFCIARQLCQVAKLSEQ